MIVDWRKVDETFYTATVDGSTLELEDADGAGWYLYSPLVDHAGVGYLGIDLHSAIHVAVALLSAKYRIDGWTIDGAHTGGLAWGSPAVYASLEGDPDEDLLP